MNLKSERPQRRIAASNRSVLSRSIFRWGWLSAAIAALASGAVLIDGYPLPSVHDEFSYLLAADTFAAGRLANPSPPLPDHFETFHVLVKPTYASKYQAGQGLILALGQTVAGHAAWGSVLATFLSAIALHWMLRQFYRSMWAMAGAGTWALNHAIQTEWTDSFWGGQLAFAGGAIVIGTLGHRCNRRHVPAIMIGLGGGILMLTRPYEGFVLVCLVILLRCLRRPPGCERGSRRRDRFVRFAVVVAITLTPFALFQLAHNVSVTGDPLQLPYTAYESTRSEAPLFFWQSPRDVELPEVGVLREQNDRTIAFTDSQRSFNGWRYHKTIAWTHTAKLISDRFTTLPWLLPILLFARWRNVAIAGVIVLAGVASNAVVPYAFPHYFAPFLPATTWLIVIALRRLSTFRHLRSHRRTIPVAWIGLLSVLYAWHLSGHPSGQRPLNFAQRVGLDFPRRRAAVLEWLHKNPGRDLVLVRYERGHPPVHEWVYNRADISSAEVVWARDLGSRRTAELIERFPNRRVWMLNADRR